MDSVAPSVRDRRMRLPLQTGATWQRAAGAFVAAGLLCVCLARPAHAGGESGDPTLPGHGSTVIVVYGQAPATVPVGIPTPEPVDGPRYDPMAIPHTDVISLPLIANMALPPQIAEAAAVYAGQTQYTPGAGVARTITQYSVGTTLLPAGSPPVAEPGTLASPQVDVVVRAPSAPPVIPRVQQPAAAASVPPAALPAAVIAASPNLMPKTTPQALVVVQLPAPAAPAVPAAPAAPSLPAPAAPVATALPVVPVAPAQPAQAAAGQSAPCCAGVVVIGADWTPADVTLAPRPGLQQPAPQQPGPVVVAPAAPKAPAAPVYVLPAREAEKVVCNAFNGHGEWASVQSQTDIWSDWYGGWGPFAVDDGFRQAKNTTFSLERVVGPGENYGEGYAVKIASNQPYAGGFGSPLIPVRPGATVTVRVKYLIWDYIQDPGRAAEVRDWASMGVKPDAHAGDAVYVNGYVRGQWAQLQNTVVAGPGGQIMILIQGESVAAVNSNIYFDDVQVFVDGEPITQCVYG